MSDLASRGVLARKIKAAREHQRWTQADLAHRAQLSRSWVAAVESGTQETPRLDFLRRVADVLSLDLASLMADDLIEGPAQGRPGDVAAIHGKLDRILDNQDAMVEAINESLEGFRAISAALVAGHVTPELRRTLADAFRPISGGEAGPEH